MGGGHAHLLVLMVLAAKRPQGVHITLISASRWQHYSGMLPGWMKGQYALDDCRIDLLPLVQKAGVKFIEKHVVSMDADQQHVCLSDGTRINYDLLSLNVGSQANTESLDKLGHQLLPIKPLADFCDAWPALVAQARAAKRWQLGVVGGGAAGVEAVLSAAVALKAANASVSLYLIAGTQGVLPGHSHAVRQYAEQALRKAGIVVIQRRTAAAAKAGNACLLLDGGQELVLDAVIAATGASAPAWLGESKLLLNERGFVAVNGHHQSTSHANVFAVGDVCARTDRVLARSGVHAVRASPVLSHNLLAWLDGRPLRTYLPRRWSLYLLATDQHEAIASWGPMSAMGGWVWRWKDHIDRQFMARFKMSLDP
jgi:pyridine nucleotide-disulfide oxidoreductase family protein